MYDNLRNQYQLKCPTGQTPVWVSISSFRSVKRLQGAMAPAVFRVQYSCPCGDEHESLITHDRLDLDPISPHSSAVPFLNLLTGSRELLSTELTDISETNIRKGQWPWTFYCHAESTHRPGFPSSIRMVSPVPHERGDDRHGVLVRCSTCERMTINLVTRNHLDVPFFNDATIHFIDRMVSGEDRTVEEAFRTQLDSAWFRVAG